MPDTYPDKYLLFNDLQTKNLSVVIQIEGVSDLLSMVPLYTRLRYGDPVRYGEGYVYGGLRKLDGVRDILSLESSLTLSQKIEPDTGKGSISTLSLTFIDEGKFMTELCSPGIRVDELMGDKEIKIYLGYQQTSFREDYYCVFRGLITGTSARAGKVTLQISDANFKRKTKLFYPAKTTLSGSINSTQTSIPVVSNSDFFGHILGPDGVTFDTSVRTWIKVGSEYMEYGPGGKGVNTFTVLRGPPNSRTTTPEIHPAGEEVSQGIQFQGHVIDLALKLMLSGKNGPYIENIPVRSIVQSGDPAIGNPTDSIFLDLATDADDDLGIAIGDWVRLTGGANAGSYKVLGFRDLFDRANRGIIVAGTLTLENPATGVTLSVRSKSDVYPKECGLAMKGTELDIRRFDYFRNGYLAGGENSMRLFLEESTEGKAFIESELMSPIGAYSLTRFGRVSIGVTLPPIAGAKLPRLDADSVLDPETITISRSLNNRRFYNEVDVDYNFSPSAGRFTATTRILDSNSLSIIGVPSILSIKAKGIYSDLGGELLISRRTRSVLRRYKDAAFEVDVSVNWGVGSTIEAGDIVLLVDEGNLQISNFSTGERDLGIQLFEVIDRQVDIKSGRVKLKLLSNLGFDLDDRFATVSPSSQLTSNSTASIIEIKDSYGAAAGIGKEDNKWTNFIGLPVRIHSWDETRSGVTTLGPPISGQPYRFSVSPALSFTPLVDDVLDIAFYPTSADKVEDRIYKLLHAHLDPSITIVTGISTTQFTVSALNAVKFQVGLSVSVHSPTFNLISAESKVLSVVGMTITLATALSFIPAAGHKAELIGFQDGGGPYRML